MALLEVMLNNTTLPPPLAPSCLLTLAFASCQALAQFQWNLLDFLLFFWWLCWTAGISSWWHWNYQIILCCFLYLSTLFSLLMWANAEPTTDTILSSRTLEWLPASSEVSPNGELRFFIAETAPRHTESSHHLPKRSCRHHIFESCLKPSPSTIWKWSGWLWLPVPLARHPVLKTK